MLPHTLIALALSIVPRPPAAHAERVLIPSNTDSSARAAKKNTTIIIPGEHLIAKLECLGCPTVQWKRLGSGEFSRSINYTEENALVSLSRGVERNELANELHRYSM
jgi:hypothetical protein